MVKSYSWSNHAYIHVSVITEDLQINNESLYWKMLPYWYLIFSFPGIVEWDASYYLADNMATVSMN